MDSYLIPIHGIIGVKPEGDESRDIYFGLTDFLIHLKKAKEFATIILDLNTPGGDCETADTIISLLNDSKKTIIARNSGDVMSAGVSIMLAAKKENRFYDSSKGAFLAHFPWGGIEGEADEIEEYAKMLRKIESKYVSYYAEKTGTDEDTMRAIMAQDIPLTSEQVEALGFANLIKKPSEIKAIAMFNYKNSKMTNEQVEKKLGAIEAFMLKISAYFKPKALVVADVNGAELDFGAEITDPSQIVIGVMATVNGAPAQGKYVMADGSILVFENGSLTEIVASGSDDMEALKKENEILKSEIEKYKTDSESQKQKAEKIEGEFNQLKKEFNDIKSFYKPEKPGANTPSGQKGERKKLFI